MRRGTFAKEEKIAKDSRVLTEKKSVGWKLAEVGKCSTALVQLRQHHTTKMLLHYYIPQKKLKIPQYHVPHKKTCGAFLQYFEKN